MSNTATETTIESVETIASESNAVWLPTSDAAVAQQDFIESCLNSATPVILWGGPGTGKTQTVRAIARKLGYNLVIVIGSRKEPTFLEGIPIVTRPSEAQIADIHASTTMSESQKQAAVRARTVNALPDWFEYAVQNPKTIIFWDEIGSIPEDVQAPMLSVIEEREIDGVRLPDEVRFIAAGNDIDQAANGQYLAPPFANRWAHHKFALPDSDWVEGFRQNFGQGVKFSDNASADEKKGAQDKHDRLMTELARLSGYLNTNAAAITPPVDSNPEVSGKAWASRRTWTKLANLLAHTEPSQRLVRDTAIASLIGLDQGNAFKAWDASLNLPSLEELIAHSKDDKFDWGKFETDKVYAILAYSLNFTTKENFAEVVHLFVKVAEQHQAIGFVMSGELAALVKPLNDGQVPQSVFPLLGQLSAAYKKTQVAAGGRRA